VKPMTEPAAEAAIRVACHRAAPARPSPPKPPASPTTPPVNGPAHRAFLPRDPGRRGRRAGQPSAVPAACTRPASPG
jgi:hypothetical protein